MKNLRIYLFIAFVAGILALVSCDPLEPSTYTTTFNRIVTVRNNGDVAWLSIDYTNEIITLRNFRTSADMEAFGVKDGDRAVAQITLSVIANAGSGVFTLDGFVNPIKVYELDTTLPSDTVDSYINFDKFSIDATWAYPRIWTNGSFLNFTISHYPDIDKKDNVDIRLYPKELIADTLVLDLRVSVPGNSYKNNKNYSFCCYDLSSLRNQATDSTMQVRVDTIMAGMLRLGLDSLYVRVETADSLYIKDRSDSIISLSGISQTARFLFSF
ncbi:MAG TPA: hypothetical protein VFC94_03355 [Bacteroidaceae bacterium]|nr:hypothetical protein [Bacteroidaceae bacterium]